MRQMMKGNEAIAEAAVQAGCRYFFGYPITPQNEIPEYMSARLPEVGGAFLQAESEVSAINMVFGAASTGARVMTSSSSPGISLKQEGISYIVGAELPCVIVNMVRGGPGLGSIQPAQSDYYQATRGGGHGDYRMIVYAPASIQEAVELTQKAFDSADRYRNPVMILGDGCIGQMMEPVSMPEYKKPDDLGEKTWAATGYHPGCGRERNIINSLYIEPDRCEQHNLDLQAKYDAMKEREVMVKEEMTEDADIIVVAYGTTARIALTAVRKAREQGIKAGLIRPITVWPFPEKEIAAAAQRCKAFLTVEMSLGQMVDDVRLAVNGRRPVEFFGRTGGMIPGVSEIYDRILKIKEGL
ncbi:MAG: 3-methyl-2-oxobutanoate dehydrogenase subunit VorB [Clostridia bacterium]|nr:3-methyl-2-oxobutanoate dehydrogenase subunit VorB [Clostridia bacterium]